MSSRGQTDKEYSRSRIAEAGTRLPPVFLILEALHLLARYLFTPADKPRTEATGNNLILKCLQRFPTSLVWSSAYIFHLIVQPMEYVSEIFTGLPASRASTASCRYRSFTMAGF